MKEPIKEMMAVNAEMIGILNAIAIVSKRLAKNLEKMNKMEEK